MTHITCRLTAKNRDQLRNPTLGNRIWATLLHVHWESKTAIISINDQLFPDPETSVISCRWSNTSHSGPFMTSDTTPSSMSTRTAWISTSDKVRSIWLVSHHKSECVCLLKIYNSDYRSRFYYFCGVSFYILFHTRIVTSEMFFPTNLLASIVLKRLNKTQRKSRNHMEHKYTRTENKHKKLQPALVTYYDHEPGNGMSLSL